MMLLGPLYSFTNLLQEAHSASMQIACAAAAKATTVAAKQLQKTLCDLPDTHPVKSSCVLCVCVQLCCDNGCRSSNWAGAFDAGIEEPTGPKVLFAVKDFASLKREVCVTAVSLL
jgi:hypothetical protein